MTNQEELRIICNGLASAFRKYPDSNPTDEQFKREVEYAIEKILYISLKKELNESQNNTKNT